MKRIVTPLMLLTIFLSFTACNEKEFELQEIQSEISKQSDETRLLIYRFGLGTWQEWKCTTETIESTIDELMYISMKEGIDVFVYEKLSNPPSDPPAYNMPEKIETTDRKEFIKFMMYWLELGYAVAFNYDPDTEKYTGKAVPQE